jgi:hypothetical protein
LWAFGLQLVVVWSPSFGATARRTEIVLKGRAGIDESDLFDRAQDRPAVLGFFEEGTSCANRCAWKRPDGADDDCNWKTTSIDIAEIRVCIHESTSSRLGPLVGPGLGPPQSASAEGCAIEAAVDGAEARNRLPRTEGCL